MAYFYNLPRNCISAGKVREGTCWNTVSRWSGAPDPWARLAFRAVERRPVHELLPPHHRAAPWARLALTAVGIQGPVEVAGLAVDIDVQRVERRAALAQRITHHVGGGVEQLAQLRAGQRRRESRAIDLGPPQRFVGVDVADARHHRLVQQLALDLRVLAPQHRNDTVTIKLRVERIAGQMR